MSMSTKNSDENKNTLLNLDDISNHEVEPKNKKEGASSCYTIGSRIIHFIIDEVSDKVANSNE